MLRGTGVVSPALDRLAAQGILFTDAHATAPLCSPARGSLFTGQYPHRNGLIGLAHHGFAYHPGVQTLPSLLADGGYRTVLIGMQHESTDPTTLGFDTVDVSESRCDYVTDEAIGWLEREGVTDQPFFLTAGFFETHRPYPDDEYDHADPNAIGVPDFLPDTLTCARTLPGCTAPSPRPMRRWADCSTLWRAWDWTATPGSCSPPITVSRSRARSPRCTRRARGSR